MNSFNEAIHRHNKQTENIYDNIQISQFVDDGALWVKSKNPKLAVKKAQKALETVDNWSKKYGFLINPMKTQVVIFQLWCKLYPLKQDPHFPKLKLGNDIFSTVNQQLF